MDSKTSLDVNDTDSLNESSILDDKTSGQDGFASSLSLDLPETHLRGNVSRSRLSSSHSRTNSATSGFSSIFGGTASIGTSSFVNSPLPVGMNRGFDHSNMLGSNSIAELVDGHLRNEEGGGAHFSGNVGPSQRRPGGSVLFVNQLQPFRAPTSKDIPPVHLPPLEKVTNHEFNSYLSHITNDYDTFHSLRKLGPTVDMEDATSVASANNMSMSSSQVVDNSGVALPQRETPLLSSSTENYSVDSNEISLSSIPSVFFEENFQLDNPRIFDIVSEKSDIFRDDNDKDMDSSDRKALASNAILQEKLSWYIDTVEIKLISEISNASSSFFSALDDLNRIRKQATEAVSKINQCRSDLKYVNEKCIENGIEGLRLRQRSYNIELLSQTLVQLSTVADKTAQAQDQVQRSSSSSSDNKKINHNLDIIDAIQDLMSGISDRPLVQEWTKNWMHPIRDLRSIPGLAQVKENLHQLLLIQAESFATQFTELIIKDLEKHVESVPKDQTLERLSRLVYKGSRRIAIANSSSDEINTDYLKINLDWRANLESCLSGLLRLQNLRGASQTLTEALVKLAKNIIRMNLPSQSDNVSVSSNMTSRSASEKSKSLATALRNMSSTEAETMVIDIYTSLSELFRRFSTHQKLLLDLSLSMSTDSQSPLDVTNLLYNVVSTSQTRMVRILNVRRNQVTGLSAPEFLNYYILNAMFLSECESVCGENNQELVSCVTGHIKEFISRFHAEKDKELSYLMDKDIWKEEEISKDFQDIVDVIVSSSTKDPVEWQDTLQGILSSVRKEEVTTENKEPSTKKRPRNVFVENSSFIVSQAAINSVYILQEYMKLIVWMPNTTSETMNNLLELVRKYNSKTTQLILGAGATRSAGLKHITAKHLALASNGLGLISTILPFIKEFCRRHTQITSIISEFDKVIRQLTDHRNEIHKKFVSLMADKVTLHGISISKIDWSETSPPPGHRYILDLVKDTTILVKIMNNLLPKQTCLLITSEIFDIYKRKLLDEYTKVSFKANIEKKNMLQDIEYFNEKLGSVEGSGNAAQVLLENVRAMPAPEEEPLFDSEKAELNNREQGKEFVQLPQSEAKELEKDAKVEKTEQPKSAVQTENADSKSDRDSKLEKQSEEGLVEEPSISSNNLENSQSTSNVAEKLDNNSDVTISEGDTSLQSVNDISNEAEKLDDKTGDVDPRLNSEQVDNNLSVDKGVNYAETAKAGISNNNGVDSSTVKDHPSSKEAVASTKDSDPLHSMVPSKESDDIVDYIRPTEELKTKSIDDDDQIKGSNEVEKEGNPNLSSFGQNIENGSTAEDPTAEKVR